EEHVEAGGGGAGSPPQLSGGGERQGGSARLPQAAPHLLGKAFDLEGKGVDPAPPVQAAQDAGHAGAEAAFSVVDEQELMGLQHVVNLRMKPSMRSIVGS